MLIHKVYNNFICFLDKYLFLFLYLSLILGFFLNENTLGGSLSDYQTAKIISNKFSENFINTILNYHQEPHRHSPLLVIILSIFEKYNVNDLIIRIINLHFLLLIIYFFKKCLEVKLINIDKKIINIISSLILISATYRSLSIWPDSRLYGILFFIISILFFLKFLETKIIKDKYKYSVLNTFFLAIASYFSPNFCVFVIFFIFYFIRFFVKSKFIYVLFLLNILLSAPAIYYVFFLKIFFFLTPATANINNSVIFNPANKILLISSIFLFHFFPFIFFIKYNFKKFVKYSTLIFPIFLFSIYFFNYKSTFTGGGIIFKISNILFGNNYLLYGFSLFGLMLICYLSYKNFNNFLLTILIFLNNPQLEIYHKYYDPMLLILFFTLFDLKFQKPLLEKRVIILYFFNGLFLIANLLR